jgi:hypothetical protein
MMAAHVRVAVSGLGVSGRWYGGWLRGATGGWPSRPGRPDIGRLRPRGERREAYALS